MSTSAIPNEASIQSAMAAVAARGVEVEIVDTRDQALERLKAIIPPSVSVMTGASLTLKEIGFEDYLVSGAHPWKNLKAEYVSLPEGPEKAALRRQALLADCFLGSVHAVLESGELLIASASGSQLAAYTFMAKSVIWVVGVQKVCATLDAGMRRLKEYIMPHEELRMRELTGGKMGTMLGKLLVFEREAPFLGRKLRLLFVREPTGD